MLGYTRQELLSLNIRDLVPEEALHACRFASGRA